MQIALYKTQPMCTTQTTTQIQAFWS